MWHWDETQHNLSLSGKLISSVPIELSRQEERKDTADVFCF